MREPEQAGEHKKHPTRAGFCVLGRRRWDEEVQSYSSQMKRETLLSKAGELAIVKKVLIVYEGVRESKRRPGVGLDAFSL